MKTQDFAPSPDARHGVARTVSGVGAGLIDRFARRISYLRLSVTDRCDLRCTYCMPEKMTFASSREVLSSRELLMLAAAFVDRGVTKIRLTGGEPLVRRDIADLAREMGLMLGRGLSELTLTTNGTLLEQYAEALFAAGVRRVNVSLDTLDRAVYARLARRDRLPAVLSGIAAAQAAGLAVKINTVALKGINEHALPDLIAWAHARSMEITLIEVMPLGDVDEDRVDQHLPLGDLPDRLRRHWTLMPSDHRSGGPARYYEIAETGGRLGLITPLTNNFCDGCNRIRVTATGQLHTCLGNEGRVDLRSALRADDREIALDRALALAMMTKAQRHEFAIDRRNAAPAVRRHMSATGG